MRLPLGWTSPPSAAVELADGGVLRFLLATDELLFLLLVDDEALAGAAVAAESAAASIATSPFSFSALPFSALPMERNKSWSSI